MEEKKWVNPIPEREREIQKFWADNKIFEKTLEATEKGKPYIFYDGPPFATGLPHYGHLLASILKDIFPRYFTMKGHYVKRNWGWDCHGLPVENIAERELGINSKDEIEVMGVKKFNAFCRSKVLTYADDWKEYINRIGRWVDFDNGYKTMDTDYIESVWWAFKQLYEKEYVYEGEKILMYCPHCATPLAKSEIAMDNSYKTVKDITVVVKFKLKDEDVYALAWTTTPWTLPSNLALTVNPEVIYAYVKDNKDGNTYLLAKSLLPNFYPDFSDYEIIKEVSGKELEGLEYEPLYPYFAGTPNAFKFLLADFVTAEDGTGIVHTAPAFGEEDNVVCRQYKISMVQPVDEKGHFTDEVTDYAGKYIYDVNEQIVIDLKKSGKAIMSRKMDHEYPFCYRCDTKLMYRALPAWFVDIQKIKPRLLELNSKINWIPEFLRDGRMRHNIDTAPDWNITRNRYWATAMPVWKSESGKVKVLGSIEELKQLAIDLPIGEIDLHKDYLDDVHLEIDGETYNRIPEVLDCWFESGSMTFAQFHYPFENKEFFDANFPAQYVVEYIGQTRAWFYYMIVLSAILFDEIPFENVLTTGTILAEDGEKMSKSKNNYPDPLLLVEKYGADALRMYLSQSTVVRAENFNFCESGVKEVYQKVIMLLQNILNFYKLYQPEKNGKHKISDNILDQWLVAKLNLLIADVTKYMDAYDLIRASRLVEEFVNEFSTWWLRRSRDRFKGENIDDKEQALATFRLVLLQLSKVIAPIIPFIAEHVYKEIGGELESVHLENWPASANATAGNAHSAVQSVATADDTQVIEQMDKVRKIVELGLAARAEAGMKIRQPLGNFQFSIFNFQNNTDEYLRIIAEELNVKKVEYKKDLGEEVKLDLEITEELKIEGALRELVRSINDLRKKAGLSISDRVDVRWSSEGEIVKKVFDDHKLAAELTHSTLSKKLLNEDNEGKEVDVNGEKIKLEIVK